MHRILRFGLVVGVFLFAAAMVVWSAEKSGAISYPEGYRHWAHVKSMVIQEGHSLYQAFGGIHHVYANDAAWKALQAHKPYPDGAMFVFDLLEASVQDHAIVEGARKVLAVMVKDSKRFPGTGGWGFQAFQGKDHKPIVTDAAAQCFNCHQSARGQDFVFSQMRP